MFSERVKDIKAFSEVKHIHDDLVASLDYVPVYKSIIYVRIWLVKSTHQQVILQQNAQNTAIERFLHPRKTSDFLADTGRDVMFATRIVLHV